MHEYYKKNQDKLRKTMDGYLCLAKKELEEATKISYEDFLNQAWDYYVKNCLEYFPYIGGDDVSGTGNLTGSYMLVAMAEVLKKYGISTRDSGHIMVYIYERNFDKMPGVVKKLASILLKKEKILNKAFTKKDLKNAENAKKNPGSFETKTMIPPEEGYYFSYHNLVCPLSLFAKERGYEEYMPYLCNLDYVMLKAFGAAMQREHTCFEDGDYCDFKVKRDATPLEVWPPVFEQDNPYK